MRWCEDHQLAEIGRGEDTQFVLALPKGAVPAEPLCIGSAWLDVGQDIVHGDLVIRPWSGEVAGRIDGLAFPCRQGIFQYPEGPGGNLHQAVGSGAARGKGDREVRVVAEAERQRDTVGVLDLGLDAEPAGKQPVGHPKDIVGRPQGVLLRVIAGGLELSRDPSAVGPGPMIDHARGFAADETVGRILLRRVIERELKGSLIPDEATLANPVGEGEQDRNATPGWPAVREQLRVGIEQVQFLAVAPYLPLKTVEPEGRPHLGPVAGIALECMDRSIEAPGCWLLSRVDRECHDLVPPSPPTTPHFPGREYGRPQVPWMKAPPEKSAGVRSCRPLPPLTCLASPAPCSRPPGFLPTRPPSLPTA